ncbi:hypothetical protein O1D18_001122 [Vibrio cholerae]|nr:hypothetical protein [Vibrio cholerae]
MSKHKHYEMIVAKAANMDLVVFVKNDNGWACFDDLPINPHQEFFLCLPQHKDVVLSALNGEKIQIADEGTLQWDDYYFDDWDSSDCYMTNFYKLRIKPRKEKRWIGYCASTNQCTPHPTKTKDLAIDYAAAHYNYADSDWQFIEIEVEVAA